MAASLPKARATSSAVPPSEATTDGSTPLASSSSTIAVPPLAAAYGLEGVLDEALTSLANVYIETGDHRLLARLDAAGFEHLTRGLRRGHFSHR